MKKKPTGRTLVKGISKDSLSFKRTAYKVDLKLAVLAYWSESHDVERTLRKFWPNDLDDCPGSFGRLTRNIKSSNC